ncbi:MAG: hypothetical protein L3J39_02465 [Verrucomicrobiales bacterium]|nr:hypothetical protein [Verrucomicrobiales bacterium]
MKTAWCTALVLTLSFVFLQNESQAQKNKTPSAKAANAHANKRATAHRDGKIWAALIFATPEKINTTAHTADQKTITRLSKAFTGKNFQLLGEHTQHIFSEYESWVVPSKDLFLKIDSKGPTGNNDGVNLHLQLWRDKNVLLKTDVILRQQPIFITGPKWGKGQLIMVIELR